ncbi:transcriptional regulator EpsA [compost metagenome]
MNTQYRAVKCIAGKATADAVPGRLAGRQGSVLFLMLEGLPNKEIAQLLGLTENAVQDHVSDIFHRLDVSGRLQAMSRMNCRSVRETPSVDTSFPSHKAFIEHDQSFEPAQSTSITPEELGLTERQGAVLVQLLEGLPNKLIARRLGLSVNTVKEHVSAILHRLGARTRTQVMSQMKNVHVRPA